MTVQTSSSVTAPDAADIFRELVEHLSENDIPGERVSDRKLRFEHEGCRLDFGHDDAALTIDISAPDANMLYFLKEAAAGHVAEINPAVGETLLWSDDVPSRTESGRPSNFHDLTVAARREVYPGMLRLTLIGDRIEALGSGGLHVKLMRPVRDDVEVRWPEVAENGVTRWPKGPHRLHVRYFTLRHLRLERGEVDVDVVRHDGGQISDWAAQAAVGDKIGIMGPAGDAHLPPDAKRVFLCGDETALPAIARLVDGASELVSGQALIALPAGVSLHDYMPRTAFDVRVISRSDFSARCLDEARAMIGAQSVDFAWFGGEAADANAMRALFKQDLGLAKGRQLSVAYWRQGEAGRADRI